MKATAILLLIALAAVGCSAISTPTHVPPTPDARATETQIAFNIFATKTASAPTATAVPTPTNTPIPTIAALPAETKPSSVTPAANVIAALGRDSDFTILPDGDIQVQETWQIQFKGGPFTYGFRSISLDKLDAVTDMTLSELGEPYQQSETEGIGTYRVYREAGEQYLKWFFPPTSNSNRTFILRYRIKGAIRISKQGDVFWWNALESNRGYAILNSLTTVHLPMDFDPDSIKATITKGKGTVNTKDGRTIVFSAQNISSGSGLEIYVQFPHGAINADPPAWQATAEAPVLKTATKSAPTSLVEARHDFKTKLVAPQTGGTAVPNPPPSVARLVHYDSPVGRLPAYLTLPPESGRRFPAIIWIQGGVCNELDDFFWRKADPANDQTASAFRKAGIVTMFPSLRGGNDNPGRYEGFLGEVDDILAAADYLANQDFIDPQRIYLGGHSTGGTMVLLVAESSSRFRAVFSFGPVSDIRGYRGYDELLPFDQSNSKEFELRSPVYWLDSIASPVFVLEGTKPPGNLDSLDKLSSSTRNPMVHFHRVRGFTHFSILAPMTQVIADKILGDNGPTANIVFAED